MTEGCLEIQGYLVGHPHLIALYEDVTNGLDARSKFPGEKHDLQVALRKRANVAS